MTNGDVMSPPDFNARERYSCDVLVVGGGTAGTMAALTAGEAGADVMLLEKAHVRHSGALAMGMDGVNNAVIPGKAEPEDYVAEITRANDGIVDQRTIYQTATRGFGMITRLEKYGVKFEKDSYGEYAVRRVHRSGSYVLPMPEGKDVKKALYRELRKRKMRERVRIENRLMPVRVLTVDGRAVGVAALHTRSGAFVEVRARSVILATGPCGRLGLPASGYLYGTYENPTNAGDGYSMAYHAGAELSGIECFQINPLIKDYNGPACAYVANPFGGYQVNADGERFVDSDYWSGAMIAEVKSEIDSARGPIYLKVSHLPTETIDSLEGILHTTERPTRGTFHAGRGHSYHTHDIEMHVSEIGLCSGHSASGIWVDDNGATTVEGLYAAGDVACVPHNYMIGAFVYGELAGRHATDTGASRELVDHLPDDQLRAAYDLIYRPLTHPDGPPQPQVEYKLRRFVNDYVAPPKTDHKLRIAVETFARMEGEIAAMGARTPHELMRCVEVTFIRDCAELAARTSLVRTESRWGLYHDRPDRPDRDDTQWGVHLNVLRAEDGSMRFRTRPVAPYLVPVDEFAAIPGDPTDITDLTVTFETNRADPHAAPRERNTEKQPAPSPAIVALLALESPTVEDVGEYLADPDPRVRTTAIATLTEHTPPGFTAALAERLHDDAQPVRHAAADGLRELVEILEPDVDLAGWSESTDPVVRAAVLAVLAARQTGTSDRYLSALGDNDHRVRVVAVHGLVSLNLWREVASVSDDVNREVRVAVAQGLATIAEATAGDEGADYVRHLLNDRDPLVRASALEALAVLGDDEDQRALSDASASPAWQVRKAAARGAAALTQANAVPLLERALVDPHLDVRKAAVIALGQWRSSPQVRELFEQAGTDIDADVRAYARLAQAVR